MANHLIDETGNTYGLLKVISLMKDQNNRTAWLCQCICGNTKIARGSDLREGRITTCGRSCKYKRMRCNAEDLTGKRFNHLTVLYRCEQNSSSNKPKWHCICDCGRECDVIGNDLKSEKTKSCGCLKSSYEEHIATILDTYTCIYKREVSFKDLYGDSKPLRFDFGIYIDNQLIGLIEYQGDQHYYPIKGWGGLDYLQQLQRYDSFKKEYCNLHNIPLCILSKKNIDEPLALFLTQIGVNK